MLTRITRSSADADKPARRVERSIKVTQTVAFHMLGSILLCNSSFVFTIFDFKNAMTLKTGLGVRQGHWKCHRSIECI